MMNLKKAQRSLWLFGLFKIPIIGFVAPRIIEMDEKKIIVKVPYRRRTRNHLNSVYLGALVVGADIVAGFHAFFIGKSMNKDISIAFKDIHAEFIKRPMADVYFVCEQGEMVTEMINQSVKTGERITQSMEIKAYTGYYNESELVANFSLGLSLKNK